MTSTSIAAWWGAIIASLVFLWDIYKWASEGPRLTMNLSPNMLIVGDPRRERETWVSVTIVNIGIRPTTIKTLGMEYYDDWFSRLLNRADQAGVFPNPSDLPLPRVLNPGEEWVGLIPQENQERGLNLIELAQNGHLMIWLSQSHKKRTLRKRLKPVRKNRFCS